MTVNSVLDIKEYEMVDTNIERKSKKKPRKKYHQLSLQDGLEIYETLVEGKKRITVAQIIADYKVSKGSAEKFLRELNKKKKKAKDDDSIENDLFPKSVKDVARAVLYKNGYVVV